MSSGIGVGVVAGLGWGVATSSRDRPQELQNLLSGGLVCPHSGHDTSIREPQALQNRAVLGLAMPQLEQSIVSLALDATVSDERHFKGGRTPAQVVVSCSGLEVTHGLMGWGHTPCPM